MRISIFIAFLFLFLDMQAQSAEFKKTIDKLIQHSIPLISSEKLKQWIENEEIILLDARDKKEFNTSHIHNAVRVGYDDYSEHTLNGIPINKTVVVYCSVGYRSEKIAEKVSNLGFEEVYNLYGGIFDWVNKGNAVYNALKETNNVHTYNKDWSKWIQREGIQKVY